MVKVSILCPTFNHGLFIKQALESFVSQKTNFDFEVVVHDDASTDETPEIIRKFEKRYPNIIKPIFQIENQFSRGNYGMIKNVILPEARGEYFVICEGDDFFTDENKLQLQVDFLDKNRDCIICFHPGKIFFEGGEGSDSYFPEIRDEAYFTVENLVKSNFMLTNSVMYRKLDYKELLPNIIPGDWYLHLFHAKFGKIGFINKIMSAYRRHPGGTWWNANRNPDDLFKKYGVNHFEMYIAILRLYANNSRIREVIMGSAFDILNQLADLDRRCGTSLIETVYLQYVEDSSELLKKTLLNKEDVEKISCEIKIKYREGGYGGSVFNGDGIMRKGVNFLKKSVKSMLNW